MPYLLRSGHELNLGTIGGAHIGYHFAGCSGNSSDDIV